MLSHVYHWVIYFIIPGTMIAILVAGILISQRVPSRYRLSARAGLGAGVVAFIIYIAASFRNLKAEPPSASTMPTFHWLPAVIGLVLGFAILLLLQLLKLAPALVGLFFLFLVTTSSTAAFSYFFVSRTRFHHLLCAERTSRNPSVHHLFLRERCSKGDNGTRSEPVGVIDGR